MASVKAPLLSLGASGKFAKTLVGTSWKGIDVLREYVIPANPRTAAQTTQRNLFAAMVSAWRNYLTASSGRDAWDRWALNSPLPQSGFNGFMSQAIKVAASDPDASFSDAVAAIAGGLVEWTMKNVDDGAAGDEAGNFDVWIGDTPSSLLYFNSYAIAAGKVTTAFLGAAGLVKYIKLRKGGYDRAGIAKVTLLA